MLFLSLILISGQTELVETPPTPFADRLLEQELARAKESPARNATSHFDRHATAQLGAAMFPLSDIESFIAKVTVPPPPDDTVKLTSKDMKSSTQDFAGNYIFIFALSQLHHNFIRLGATLDRLILYKVSSDPRL